MVRGILLVSGVRPSRVGMRRVANVTVDLATTPAVALAGGGQRQVVTGASEARAQLPDRHHGEDDGEEQRTAPARPEGHLTTQLLHLAPWAH